MRFTATVLWLPLLSLLLLPLLLLCPTAAAAGKLVVAAYVPEVRARCWRRWRLFVR